LVNVIKLDNITICKTILFSLIYKISLVSLLVVVSAGAKITVISPELGKTIQAEMAGDIHHIAKEFSDDDITGYRLITAATNDSAVNRRVSELAQAINVPVLNC